MTLIDTIRKDAKAAKWAGIFLLVAGFISLVSPLAAGLSITVIIGVMLLLGGAAQLLVVFRLLQAEGEIEKFKHLLSSSF